MAGATLVSAMQDLLEAVQQGREIWSEIKLAAEAHRIPERILIDYVEKSWGPIDLIGERRAKDVEHLRQVSEVRERARVWTEEALLNKYVLVHMSFDAWLKGQGFDREMAAVARLEFDLRFRNYQQHIAALAGTAA